jgi:hypothetical protein
MMWVKEEKEMEVYYQNGSYGNITWGVNCIHLAQDIQWCQALVNTIMNLQVP